MPQIGWFEILVIVILAILVVGPKDFPIMLRKIGNWISSVKNYFSDIQKDVKNMETEVEDSITSDKKYSNQNEDKQRNE